MVSIVEPSAASAPAGRPCSVGEADSRDSRQRHFVNSEEMAQGQSPSTESCSARSPAPLAFVTSTIV
jgi:hypothetical protein